MKRFISKDKYRVRSPQIWEEAVMDRERTLVTSLQFKIVFFFRRAKKIDSSNNPDRTSQ